MVDVGAFALADTWAAPGLSHREQQILAHEGFLEKEFDALAAGLVPAIEIGRVQRETGWLKSVVRGGFTKAPDKLQPVHLREVVIDDGELEGKGLRRPERGGGVGAKDAAQVPDFHPPCQDEPGNRIIIHHKDPSRDPGGKPQGQILVVWIHALRE